MKIIKILTAIGNSNLNNMLKKENEFEVLENDIFYREGILEFLEKNRNIDILILYEKLNGEIEIIDLIKSIKKINNKINIFFILENENYELEKFLKKENIKDIFINDEIDIKKFIEEIKKINFNNNKSLEEEIMRLKDLINKKDEEIIKYKNNIFQNSEKNKIVTIIGEKKIGKSLIISNLKKIYENIYERNLDYEFKEIDITDINEIKNLSKISYKFIFIYERDLKKIKINRKIIDDLIKKNRIDYEKINIIFNKVNKYSINKRIVKNIFYEIKILGNIKLNIYSDYLLNKKNNYKNENIKLKKEYLKIIRNLK